MPREVLRTAGWVTAFAVAMGFLEAAVVVFLRFIYYPDGFAFPLVPIAARLANVEVMRELATVVMLFAVGWLAGRNNAQRFAYFAYAFAVWDIVYYVSLYLSLGWPESLLTWDLLFLVPFPWVGPVITPVLVALSMIALAGVMLRGNTMLNLRELGVLTLSSLVLITSWCWDYARWVLQDHGIGDLFAVSFSGDVLLAAKDYVPASFNWWVFGLGLAIWYAAVALYWRRAPLQEPGLQT